MLHLIRYLHTFWILTLFLSSCYSEEDYLTTDDVPNPGPESPSTVYVPGTPGAQWTPHEVDTTRQRIIQMIHPQWNVKTDMGKYYFWAKLLFHGQLVPLELFLGH